MRPAGRSLPISELRPSRSKINSFHRSTVEVLCGAALQSNAGKSLWLNYRRRHERNASATSNPVRTVRRCARRTAFYAFVVATAAVAAPYKSSCYYNHYHHEYILCAIEFPLLPFCVGCYTRSDWNAPTREVLARFSVCVLLY